MSLHLAGTPITNLYLGTTQATKAYVGSTQVWPDALSVLWLQRTAGTALRNGTTSHTLSFTPAAAGSLLVAITSGSVVSTATSPGWIKRLSPVHHSETAVFTLSASGGEASLDVSHNGANYPIIYSIYEFPAGTTWVAGTGAPNGEAPDLAGLPGTPVLAFTVIGMPKSDPIADTTMTWESGWTEDMDMVIASDGVTDGAYLGIGWRSQVTTTSISPTTDNSGDAVYAYSPPPAWDRTCATFALNVP